MSNTESTVDREEPEWRDAVSTNGAKYRIRQTKADEAAAAAETAALPPPPPKKRVTLFDVAINWPATTKRDWVRTDGDFAKLTGIQEYRNVYDQGIFYDYNLEIMTDKKGLTYLFTDSEPDTYSKECLTTGAHDINFNSKNATFVRVQGIRYEYA
jgi:hypothetical protein